MTNGGRIFNKGGLTAVRAVHVEKGMKMNKISFILLFSMVAAMGATAAEYFADAVNGNDANDGLTEATAKLSLKEAIALANTDDIVTLLPGDYSNGTVYASSAYSRAQIDKRITLRSKNGRASRDVTRIVGAYDDNAMSTGGLGPNAIRCLRIAPGGSECRIEGITFYHGATDYNGNSGAEKSEGGGVYVNSSVNATIVDCAFVDCRSTRGGGAYTDAVNNNSLKAVRCLFLRCCDTKFGAGMRGGAAYNCVFDDCGTIRINDTGLGEPTNAKHAFSYGYSAVNCTFVNNEGSGVQGAGNSFAGGICNCLFQNNAGAISSTPSGTMANNTENTAYTTRMNVFSPYDGDYRLTMDSDGLGAGSAEYLALIPEEFRGTDYYGNARTTGETVHAGAVQDALTEAASGIGVSGVADGRWTLDGEPIAVSFRTWRGTIGWPVPQKVGFVPAEGYALVRFSLSETPVWPLPDDTAWFHPSRIGRAQTVGAVTTTTVFYADPENGSDETGDGSEANPFETITKAIQFSTSTHVVRAKAGDYNSGYQSVCGFASRVAVQNTFKGDLRVVAVDGPDSTFITGVAGTANNYQIGTDAVRCIGVACTNKFRAAFQGFTLRNGHTTSEGAGEGTLGGGFANLASGGGSSLGTGWLLDCRVMDCSGQRGGAMAGGTALRCTFSGCLAANGSGGGVFRHCSVISSFVTGCGGASELFCGGSTAFNVTTWDNTVASLYRGNNGSGNLRNSVITGRAGGNSDLNGSNITDEGVQYCLYSKAGNIPSGVTMPTSVKEDPVLFLAKDLGDYHLRMDSAGLTLASTAFLQSCMDINGDPFVFDVATGTYQAGCYTLAKTATRYVDPVNGNDATADGTTEATAYKTLAAALAAAKAGDTVIALPGTYAEGAAVPTKAQAGTSAAPTIAARAVVPSYVTLESRDGPETTVIEGVRATVDANIYGCGSDAVRCVFLCQNATVRGFTLYNGHTGSGGEEYANTVDTRGGGVNVANAGSVANGKNSFVENCTITNCTAARGAGGFCGTYRKCKFLDNNAPKPGTAIYWGVVEGCFFDNNRGHSIIYKSPVWNSTILATAKGNISAVNNEGTYTDTHQPVVNTILGTSSFVSSNLINCAYRSATNNRWPDAPSVNPAVGDLLIGVDGVPLAGSVAIDAGDMSQTPEGLGDTDLAGGQRVYNGAMDIGCYEHDWRPKYAADLGKGVTVASASPEVYEGAGGVVTLPGGSLEAGWSNASGKKRGYSGTMRVTGTGTLTVTRNGEAFKTVTSADGEQTFQFFSTAALEELAFAYAPGENDDGAALLSGFAIGNGFMVILR